MSYELYKLTFPSGLHLDAGGYGFETSEVMIHSDTLFSALCCSANLLGGDEWVEKLISGLVISSAFPYVNNRLFFPKPLHLTQPEFSSIKYEEEKAYRKVRFFDQTLLKQALQGDVRMIADSFRSDDVKNGCWFSSNPEDVYKTIEHPRVVIDRLTSQTTIFHFQEVHFTEGGGLFFLADFNGDATLKTIFETSLGLLGDEGIGSDGTVGKGWFKVNKSDAFEEFDLVNGNRYYLLSLYHPAENELQNIGIEVSNYDIITRRGWMSALGNMDLRRQSLRMFLEGTVLNYNHQLPPKGSNSPVLPELPSVIRYGKTLTLKLN